MTKPRALRCAIYTRKSSEEGLEQDFNSLDAQREACLAYIRSQAQEGWSALPQQFDDGGFSGGNMERPGLQRLMQLIAAGGVDIIVIYKIDRLTRSLMDFAKLAEQFDRHNVSFVSVTQQFNTTTSMGRLMLNVLLSFAQFERELTGERIRDKLAASKKRGLWMGGPVPLGYDARDRALVINPEEAKIVRMIFELYLETQSVRDVQQELKRRGVRSKTYARRSGETVGSAAFSRGHLYRILGSPLYIGEISHKTERHPGLHEAIIERPQWDAVQALLASNRNGTRTRPNIRSVSPLAGLVYDEHGRKLGASHTVKSGRRYRYYVSSPDDTKNALNVRIPAGALEKAVVRKLIELLCDRQALAATWPELGPQDLQCKLASAAAIAAILDRATPSELLGHIRDHVSRIEVQSQMVKVVLRPGSPLLSGTREPRAVCLPFTLNRTGSTIIAGKHSATASKDTQIRAIACGRAWFEELVTGRAATFSDIAARVGVTDRYVSRLVNLAFLSPKQVEAVLDGRTVADVSTRGDRAVPLLWSGQR